MAYSVGGIAFSYALGTLGTGASCNCHLRSDEAVGVDAWLAAPIGLLGAIEAVPYRESRDGTGGGAVSYVEADPLEREDIPEARSSAVS